MEILEFRIFLAKACKHIPIKKLRNRIYPELREHMEDMLDDFLEAGEEREAAIQKVIAEMGDPVKINKDLRRAHRRKIVLVCAARVIALFFIITLLCSLPYLESYLSEYLSSSTKSEIEADLAKEKYSYTYYGKIEYNGRDYIFYTAETPEGRSIRYYASIKLFDRFDIRNRFHIRGGATGTGVLYVGLVLPHTYNDTERATFVYLALEETNVKFFQVDFIKAVTSNGTPDIITSDFYPVPKPGEFTIVEAPEGYSFAGPYYVFDENRQAINKDSNFLSGTGWRVGT